MISQEQHQPDYISANSEFSRYRQDILREGYVGMTDEEQIEVVRTVNEAFDSSKSDQSSHLAMVSHSIVEALVLDEAMAGREWKTRYNAVHTKVGHITNWLAMAGLMGSFDKTFDESDATARDIMTQPKASRAGFTVDQIGRHLKETYLDETEWHEGSLADVTLGGIVDSLLIYSRAARSGNRFFIAKAKEHVRDTYQEIKEKYGLYTNVTDRIRQEFAKATELEPNEIVGLMEVLEDDGPMASKVMILQMLLAGLYSGLDDMLSDPKAKQTKIENLVTVLLDSPIPENMYEMYNFDEADSDESPEAGAATAEALELKPMEVNWEVLPPGELEREARDIVSKTEYKKPTIDLGRLKALEDIRALWGADNAYYAKGTLGKRRMVRDGNELQPDEYIVLVLQDRDREGNVVAEHAVAESPIVGPHAMYLYRQDVGEGISWRKVMAVSKKDACALGARPLKHMVSSDHKGLSMVQKAELLLTCTTDEFQRIKFAGVRGFRLSKLDVECPAADAPESML